MFKKSKMLLSMAGMAVIFAGGASAAQRNEEMPVPLPMPPMEFRGTWLNIPKDVKKLSLNRKEWKIRTGTITVMPDSRDKYDPRTGEVEHIDAIQVIKFKKVDL